MLLKHKHPKYFLFPLRKSRFLSNNCLGLFLANLGLFAIYARPCAIAFGTISFFHSLAKFEFAWGRGCSMKHYPKIKSCPRVLLNYKIEIELQNLPRTNIESGAFGLLKTTMSIACSPIFEDQSICKISHRPEFSNSNLRKTFLKEIYKLHFFHSALTY